MKVAALAYRGTLVVAMVAVATAIAAAQGGWKVETGKPFHAAMVKDFYLEGNSIPTEEQNAALLR